MLTGRAPYHYCWSLNHHEIFQTMRWLLLQNDSLNIKVMKTFTQNSSKHMLIHGSHSIWMMDHENWVISLNFHPIVSVCSLQIISWGSPIRSNQKKGPVGKRDHDLYWAFVQLQTRIWVNYLTTAQLEPN